MHRDTLRSYVTRRGSRYDMTFSDEGGRELVPQDGYEFMTAARQEGWRTLPSWGNDGWDLGEWPYVVLMVRQREGGHFEVVEHVEGDLTFYEFPTQEVRADALTFLFLVWAKDRIERFADVDVLDESTWPAEVKGPYGFMNSEAAA
jgi:hypothetical protein